MKKIVVMFSVVMLYSYNIIAQDFGDIYLTPKIGLVGSIGQDNYVTSSLLSTWFYSNIDSYKNLKSELSYGYNISCIVDYYLHATVAIHTGFSFQNKPQYREYKGVNDSVENIIYKFDANYISIPLGLKLNAQWFQFGGGIFYSIPLTKDSSFSKGRISWQFDETAYKNDFGFFIISAIKYPIKKNQFIILDVTYEQGLFSLYTIEFNPLRNVYGPGGIASKLVSINIGYSFTLSNN